jgi:hypothetical protein
MAASVSPDGFWRAFLEEPVSGWDKALFLAQTYISPAATAFCAVVLFQLLQRLAMSGTASGVVWGLAIAAWSLIFHVFAGAGMMARPATIFGMATGVTIAGRIYAVRVRAWRGVKYPYVVWRGNQEAVRETDRLAALARAALRERTSA